MITLNDLVYHVWKLEVILQNLASLCINFCKIGVSMEIIFILSSCSILVFESSATLYSFSLCVYVYIYMYTHIYMYISSRNDWFDLLAVQGTLKSLLQHHSSKSSILQHSDFFIVQFSHPYMTTEKTIALTRWTFVSKVISLLFNILSSGTVPAYQCR